VLKFVLVVVLFAAVVYTIAWTLERRRTLGKGNALPKRRSKPQMKQVAPDDDEDFLRWLDRKRRKDGADGTDEPGSKDGGTDGQGQEPAAD
jgi:hypothetical protein